MSELSDLALKYAHAGARLFKAGLTVFQSLESDGQPGDEKMVRAWVRQTVEQDPEVEIVIHRGTAAAQAIRLADARSCDLIVVGAHHHPFEKTMVMGRAAELILRHAPVPVLAVPTFDEGR